MVKFVAKGVCIPHPLKAHYGGEDAHAIDEDHQLVVFSDGVGGYEKQVETQVADYSQALVARVVEECKAGASLKEAIHCAHQAVDIPGAATICIVHKEAGDGNRVSIANLGDCRVVIFRNGQAFWSSSVMQHGFNCPLQLGHPLHHPCSDTAELAAFYELEVQEGDVLLMGTDGLWDNVWVAELQQLLPTSLQSVEQCAAQMAQLAFQHSMDEAFISPFAMEAAQHFVGFDRGGKPDDITVLVALVTSDDTVDTQECAPPLAHSWCTPQAELDSTAGEPVPSVSVPMPNLNEVKDCSNGAAIIPSPESQTLANSEASVVSEIPTDTIDSASAALPAAMSPQQSFVFEPSWQPHVVWCPTFVKGGVVLLAWVELGTAQWLACAQLPNGAYWPVTQNEQAELRWWVAGEPLPLLLGARGEAGPPTGGVPANIEQGEKAVLNLQVNAGNLQQDASLSGQQKNDEDLTEFALEQQQMLDSQWDLSLGWDCFAQQQEDLVAWNSAFKYEKRVEEQLEHEDCSSSHNAAEAPAIVEVCTDDNIFTGLRNEIVHEAVRLDAGPCGALADGADVVHCLDQPDVVQVCMRELTQPESNESDISDKGVDDDDDRILGAQLEVLTVRLETSMQYGQEAVTVKFETTSIAAISAAGVDTSAVALAAQSHCLSVAANSVQLAVDNHTEEKILDMVAGDSDGHLRAADAGASLVSCPSTARKVDEELKDPCHKHDCTMLAAAVDGKSTDLESTSQQAVGNCIGSVLRNAGKALPNEKDINLMQQDTATILSDDGELPWVGYSNVAINGVAEEASENSCIICPGVVANFDNGCCLPSESEQSSTEVSMELEKVEVPAGFLDNSNELLDIVLPNNYLHAPSKLGDPMDAGMLWGCITSPVELPGKGQESAFPACWQSPEDAIGAHWRFTDADAPLCFGSWTHDEVLHCILQLA